MKLGDRPKLINCFIRLLHEEDTLNKLGVASNKRIQYIEYLDLMCPLTWIPS